VIYHIASSIVLYKNNADVLSSTIKSFLNTNLNVKLYLIDNSPSDILRNLVLDDRITYIFNGENLGFGKAHNRAIGESIPLSKYHLVLNPDVYFAAGTLEKLYSFMEQNPEVGLVLPRVLSFENELQYVCKRLPRPSDLIVRRFGSGFLKRFFKTRILLYEMHDKNYHNILEAPSLSGCFMFFRAEALKKIGLFDERFFMYMEDVDISRRMYTAFKNAYYPDAVIHHGHAKESYKTIRLLKIHAISAIRYFNKWGWIFDRERERINKNL
jgi:GT2 family glycosyltransferase